MNSAEDWKVHQDLSATTGTGCYIFDGVSPARPGRTVGRRPVKNLAVVQGGMSGRNFHGDRELFVGPGFQEDGSASPCPFVFHTPPAMAALDEMNAASLHRAIVQCDEEDDGGRRIEVPVAGVLVHVYLSAATR